MGQVQSAHTPKPKSSDPSETSVAVWINLLKTKYSFLALDANQKCPAGNAMKALQRFTDSIITLLIEKDPIAVNLAKGKHFGVLYEDYPDFHDFYGFHKWVEDANMLHPHRRSSQQFYLLKIVELEIYQPTLSLEEKLKELCESILLWRAEVYKPENLVQDPDELWVFRNFNGIIGLKKQDAGSWEGNRVQVGDTCLICAEDFDENDHSPGAAPCRQHHIVCKICYDRWLESSDGTFKCPFCRACLVCGEDDCPFHWIPREAAPPLPITQVLDRILGSSDDALHSIKPHRYAALREWSRGSRGLITWVQDLLAQPGIEPNDPVAQKFKEYSDVTWNNIKSMVSVAIQQQGGTLCLNSSERESFIVPR